MDVFMVNMDGRIGRRRYLAAWLWVVAVLTIGLTLLFAGIDRSSDGLVSGGYVVLAIGGIVTTFTTLDATGKRLHDLGRSGWYSLLLFVPLLNLGLVAILLCTAGNDGPNRYGHDPRAARAVQQR